MLSLTMKILEGSGHSLTYIFYNLFPNPSNSQISSWFSLFRLTASSGTRTGGSSTDCTPGSPAATSDSSRWGLSEWTDSCDTCDMWHMWHVTCVQMEGVSVDTNTSSLADLGGGVWQHSLNILDTRPGRIFGQTILIFVASLLKMPYSILIIHAKYSPLHQAGHQWTVQVINMI